jgi:hypothetical protein
MTDDKPDYAAIIKSRKPMPTLDLDDLRRRSAQATKTTLVLQPAPEAPGEAGRPATDAEPDLPVRREAGSAATRKAESSSAETARVPLRFSVSPTMQHELRIQAALENTSVPDLMRDIIAAYLRKQGRKS